MRFYFDSQRPVIRAPRARRGRYRRRESFRHEPRPAPQPVYAVAPVFDHEAECQFLFRPIAIAVQGPAQFGTHPAAPTRLLRFHEGVDEVADGEPLRPSTRRRGSGRAPNNSIASKSTMRICARYRSCGGFADSDAKTA